MTLVIGLTGSMGAGKSTIAAMFAERGAALFDADAAVHDLYRGRAAPLVEAAFPGTVEDGTVDRARLAEQVVDDPDAFRRLESIVHPLVREEREAFLGAAHNAGRRIVILEIQLLVEIGGGGDVDLVLVVTAPEALRRERVMARPGMTAERFDDLTARQASEREKRAHAHLIIDNGGTLAEAADQVDAFMRAFAATSAGK